MTQLGLLLQLVSLLPWELREDKGGRLSLLIKSMFDHLWLKIFSSSIQDLNCFASYSFSLVTNDTAQKLDHFQPDSLVCLTAEVVTEGAQESEGEVNLQLFIY